MQVTLSVYGCCRIVEQVVAMIECRPESLFYAGIATPPPHSRWTEEVAMQMASHDSRRYCTRGTLAEHTRPRR